MCGAHFPSVITTIMDHKVQLLKPLNLNLEELYTQPRTQDYEDITLSTRIGEPQCQFYTVSYRCSYSPD
jgi:hypothetical protein